MKIYHYTSIETLAMILKHRTLRFNNVSNVNDKDECITEDFGSLQKYCFVSCWTKNQNESIPFWKIYANNGKGVRIESDTDYIHFRNTNGVNRDMEFIVSNIVNKNENSYFINLWQSEDCFYPYFETHYSDEKKIFEKDCSTKDAQQWEYDIESAFNTKKTCWAFEEEVRFILLGCSCDDGRNVTWQKVFNNITAKKEFSEDSCYLALEQDFFDNLKITSGPYTSEADEIVIQSLINNFDDTGKIKISESKIAMR